MIYVCYVVNCFSSPLYNILVIKKWSSFFSVSPSKHASLLTPRRFPYLIHSFIQSQIIVRDCIAVLQLVVPPSCNVHSSLVEQSESVESIDCIVDSDLREVAAAAAVDTDDDNQQVQDRVQQHYVVVVAVVVVPQQPARELDEELDGGNAGVADGHHVAVLL